MTFNVIGEIDLSVSDQELYNTLRSLYRPEYNANDRILVNYFEDEYDYTDLPGNRLRRFVNYINEIDIPKFFIHVVTPNPRFGYELGQLSDELITFTFAGQEFKRITNTNKDTFCVLPWMHLYVGTDSNVLPCCVADKNYPLGKVTEHSVDEIVNSVAGKQLRLNMLNGIKCKECSYCYNAEEHGLPSYRKTSNAEWAQYIGRKDYTGADGAIAFDPHYLDIRLNNICNLKCRYCSGYYSSSIAQEEQSLYGKSSIIYETLSQSQRDYALENIKPYLSNVEKIYFAGGEPLITPEHYQILDCLIDQNKTDVELTYNTNFSKLTYKNRNVLDLWKHFSNVTVGASLDAIGSVAEYARHGTKWVDIENNLDLLKQSCPHVKFKITSTASLLTVESLIDLQVAWHTQKQIPLEDFSVSVLYTPKTVSLQTLPTEKKKSIAEQIEKHINWITDSSLAKQWQDVLTFMFAEDSDYLLPEFAKSTKEKDEYRKESFIKIYPQFKNIL